MRRIHRPALLRPKPASLLDPYFSAVSLLLHGDGTNGSTTFTDSSPSPKTITPSGVTISTAQSMFGGASMLFSAGVLSTPDSAAFDLAAGDFTVEAWVRPTSIPGGGVYMGVIGQRNTGITDFGWILYINGDNAGRARFDWSLTGTSTAGTVLCVNPMVANAWSHIAAVRSGGSVTLYQDGIGGTPATIGTDTIFNSTSVLHLGVLSFAGGGNFAGNLDDVRVTKGVARYLGNFTPPAAPFPNL